MCQNLVSSQKFHFLVVVVDPHPFSSNLTKKVIVLDQVERKSDL